MFFSASRSQHSEFERALSQGTRSSVSLLFSASGFWGLKGSRPGFQGFMVFFINWGVILGSRALNTSDAIDGILQGLWCSVAFFYGFIVL